MSGGHQKTAMIPQPTGRALHLITMMQTDLNRTFISCFAHSSILCTLMWDHTKPRQGFDLDKEPVLQDITLALGFISSLGLVLRTQRKGLSWLAVPCQSFSFMSSSCHRRSWADPYGSLNRQFVQMGNCICARSCILILVSLARSVVFFVENPLQSSLQCWPFLNYLMHMPVLGSHRTSW